jgi:hypothetical protein
MKDWAKFSSIAWIQLALLNDMWSKETFEIILYSWNTKCMLCKTMPTFDLKSLLITVTKKQIFLVLKFNLQSALNNITNLNYEMRSIIWPSHKCTSCSWQNFNIATHVPGCSLLCDLLDIWGMIQVWLKIGSRYGLSSIIAISA